MFYSPSFMEREKWRTIDDVRNEKALIVDEKAKIVAELQAISKKDFFTKNKPAVFRKLYENSKKLVQIQQELVEIYIQAKAPENDLMRAVFGLHCEQAQLDSVKHLLELSEGKASLNDIDVIMVIDQVWLNISNIVYDYLDKADADTGKDAN